MHSVVYKDSSYKEPGNMEALLDKINKDCCKYGVKTDGVYVNFTKHPWTKEDVLNNREYCYEIDNTRKFKLCSHCENKLYYVADNIRTQNRHEEMLKALSIIAVKQEKQLEQITKLASFMEQLVVHIKSLDKPAST